VGYGQGLSFLNGMAIVSPARMTRGAPIEIPVAFLCMTQPFMIAFEVADLHHIRFR
jgi:hypothetical protein